MPRRKHQQQPQTEEQDLAAGAPLFEGGAEFDHIAVTRVLPQEDAGYIGTIPKDSTLEDLRSAYGGGKFSLVPRDASSHYIKGLGSRTETIAGTPVFSNEIARKRWLKGQGVEEQKPAAAPAAPAAPAGPSVLELIMLMDKSSERARLEAREQADQRARDQAAAHERQLALLKADADRREKDLAAERDRMNAQLAADRQRDQQFMQTMISIVKGEARAASVDPLDQAGKLVELIQQLGGGGGEEKDEDPVNHLARNIGPILQQLRLMGGGGGGSGQAGAPAAARGKGGKEPLTIEGPLGERAKALFGELARRGHDPARVFEAMLAQVGRKLKAAPKKRARNGDPAAAAPPPAAAKPAAKKKTARPKATAAAARATR